MQYRSKHHLAVLLAAWLAVPAAALARPPFEMDPDPRVHGFVASPSRAQEHAGRGGISLDEAVSRARRETGGRVLSTRTIEQDGHRRHRIKVLTPNGHVRVLSFDANGR